MKRIIALLAFILWLPGIAAGEGDYFTIREIRQQAEAMVNKDSSESSIEIETSKGRYTVVLEIPEVNQVPVIKATTPSSNMAPTLPENGIVEERKLTAYLYGWTIQKQRNKLYGITDYSITQTGEYGMDVQANGSPMTMAEAIDFAEKALNSNSNWDFRLHRAITRSWRRKGANASEPLDRNGFYSLEFNQILRGIPYYDHIQSSFSLASNYDRRGGIPQGGCTFNIFSPDCYACNLDVCVEAGVLAKDVPLCSLATVIESLKASCNSEINLEKRTPARLRLVYVAMNNPEDRTGDTILIPTWILENDDGPNEVTYAIALVNAQTGQLIDTDAEDLDKGRRCDAVWITWDDVK